MDRCRLALLGVVLATTAIFPAAADVCASTNAGFYCAGPAGGRTTVTALAGCCAFVESTGPVPIGRTGVIGSGVSGTSASLTVVANGYTVGTFSATGQTQSVVIKVGAQEFRFFNHVGCCVEADASGPVSTGTTGVFGGDDVSVWVNGMLVARCLPATEEGDPGDFGTGRTLTCSTPE